MRSLWLIGLLCGCGTLDPQLGDPQAVPDGGPPVVEGCEIVDSDPETPVSFALLREAVLDPECSCHVEEGGIGRTEAGLDLADHQALLQGGINSPNSAVIPGDPCESILVQKLSNDPPFGARMPFRTFQLSEDQRQLIIDWIAEGAQP